MKRQPRDAMTAMVGALREKRAMSLKTRSRVEEIDARQMESDAWMLLTNSGEHPSANAHLWMDELRQVHEGDFQ